MKELEQKVVEIISQLQGLAKPAAQTAIDAVRAGAIMNMLAGAVYVVVAFVALKICIKQMKAMEKASTSEEGKYILGAIITGGIALIFGVTAAIGLLNSDNWLASVRPDLALARALLIKVL